MMSEALYVSDLSAGYDQRDILQHVSLSVRDGEFCALLGLNGCGKTTLLKSICGLIPIRAGSCSIHGTDCTGLNERHRALHMSYIPQRGSLILGKTVLEVVLMGANARLKLLESPGEKEHRSAWSALDTLGLTDFAHRSYESLSEGQKQLVILARALVQDAPVMLMDEPDSALDFVNRHMVLGKIRDVLHLQGKAGLITLHDPNFALAYCDSLLLMKRGVLLLKLPLKDASENDITHALSQVYGNVRVLRHEKGYVMVHA